MTYSRSSLIVLSVVSIVFLWSRCITEEDRNITNSADTAHTFVKHSNIVNHSGEAFAGSPACGTCHTDHYRDHLQTAHYQTSALASDSTIRGSFEPGENLFAFNKSVVMAMEKRDKGYYQVEYFRNREKRAEPFNVVIGSGLMGQTSLYWRDNYLFQLPITYFGAADAWSNSPGFPDKVVFNRVITSRCLECHSTHAKTISPPGVEPEKFAKDQIIYGIDCEKCHGPGAKHVAFQSANPQDSTPKYIVNPASLTRQQNLDLCALCHGGRLTKTKPSFTFTAGDSLSSFFTGITDTPDPAAIDVHGNQYGLLRASQCFIKSETLTCNSCHDTHKKEKGNTALFSQRCMSCHNTAHQKTSAIERTMGDVINTNCVDCHMPLKPSRAIAVFLPGSHAPTAAMIRSHFISIYPDETKKLLDYIKSSKGRN